MPQIPGFPERPHYNSVKAYLSELSKDIAEMVIEPAKMGRFREQLKKYAEFWQKWETFKDANQKGCWKPEMGRPECIFNIFSRSYNLFNDSEKEEKRLAGSYALCALIHDSQLPHLDKINTGIIPTEAIEETLSAPRNTLEGRSIGFGNSGPDVREIYLIEDFFNMVKVDLQEFCKSEENKLKQATIDGQIQQANELSDAEFFKLTAKKFEGRANIALSKDETWYDLDRFLKGWFDAAIERLKQLNVTENEIGLLNYIYKNLLHYAKGINIKKFRGFPDLRIVELATNRASELAAKFTDFAQRAKENTPPKKPEEGESSDIFDLLKKEYLLRSEDNLNQKIAEIAQDFMSRGFSNSTTCVGKQLSAHFEHINEMINYIVKSIEQDFSDIPLDDVKEKLFTILDDEYKKLVPFANIQLVKAGLAQQNILRSVEQQINSKKEKAKQAIETRLFILGRKKIIAVASKNSESVNTEAKTIFISHANEDAALAEIIKTQIDNVFEKKINVFVSSIAGTIRPGSDWFDNILCNLKGNNAFIVLVTPYSEKRPFVWFEIGFSWFRRLKKNCEIYAICAPPINHGNLPEPLCRLQAVSLGDEKQTEAFFLELTQQFDLGNLENLEFSKIQDSLPTYPPQITQTGNIDTKAVGFDDFDGADEAEVSDEAKAMLLDAINDKNGHILKIRNMSGTSIETNGQNLIPNDNSRTIAKWEHALDELVNNDFVEDLGHGGEVFAVTHKGYEYADTLRKA